MFHVSAIHCKMASWTAAVKSIQACQVRVPSLRTSFAHHLMEILGYVWVSCAKQKLPVDSVSNLLTEHVKEKTVLATHHLSAAVV